eukprot:TRINITY_DN8048_c0_g1_i1.p1 TRINITY_DN8048_c0_g1~~TRINITY_DN8048_c0_g1_i1.p1  ORF type:complete len:172 (-),score=28.33 TRINITY_DN8048_c0_g1_i1:43-558(-)
MVRSIVQTLVRVHPLPLLALLIAQIAFGLWPHQSAVFMGVPDTIVYEAHGTIGFVFFFFSFLLFLSKLYILATKISLRRLSKSSDPFDLSLAHQIVDGHFLSLGFIFVAQYLIGTSSRDVSNFLGISSSTLWTMHKWFALTGLFLSFCVLWAKMKINNAHVKSDSRRSKLA